MKPQDNKIIITGHPIPWSFVYRVHALCARDWDATIDCFWKARNCTGTNGIQRYIMAGLKPDKSGKRYMLTPSREREDGKMESLRSWWESLYKRKRKPEPEAAADMAAVLGGLVGAFDLEGALANRGAKP